MLGLTEAKMNVKLGLVIALTFIGISAGSGFAQDTCAAGKTIEDKVLTIGTGDPAYFPWVIDDKPKTAMGFEAAVAYELATRMGFEKRQVNWVRTSFDAALEPGAKPFDINLQQYTITSERDEHIDFSMPYYTSSAAVVVRQPTVDEGVDTTKASLSQSRWGAASGSTAIALIETLVGPVGGVQVYDDTDQVTQALKDNQIHATLVDLPTALFLAVLMLDDGVILGQYPHEVSGEMDQFGAVMADGNPLKDCVDAALAGMIMDGTIAALENKWLSTNIRVPVITQ